MIKINNRSSIPTTETLRDFEPGDVVISEFTAGGKKGIGYSTDKTEPVKFGDPLLIVDRQHYEFTIHSRTVTEEYKRNVPVVNLRTGVLHLFMGSRKVKRAQAELDVALVR